jgi:NADH:ubiquinone oxidoreductase subunit F (NADH-binding)
MSLPRLLGQLVDGSSAPIDLGAHRRTMIAPPRPSRRPHDGITRTVDEAGLRGRGGGGFPTARKMMAVAENPGTPIVVVNGSEGEPASQKDRVLLTRLPHLVLDGARWAAAAVGANEVIIAVDRQATDSLGAVHAAIVEQRTSGDIGVPISIVEVPGRFVAGEESALVHAINGGEAKPTGTRQRVFVKGVDRRPTMVSNVETFAHLAQIANHGGRWFRQHGTDDEPGTMLITLSGEVVHAGVCEVACGSALSQVVALGGGTGQPMQAVLIGGYYGAWISADDMTRATLSNASLKPLGAGVGCGALVVLPTHACGLLETAHVLHWMAGESAGQCGPCVHGLPALANAMSRLATGHGDRTTVSDLERWAAMITGRGGCTLPDGASRLVRSTLRVFAADVEHHTLYGTCRRVYNSPVLRIPQPEPVWR